MSRRLQLIVRHGCSLCEAMQHELEVARRSHDFELELVDVDSSEELVLEYGEKVPVLKGAGTEICHYFLDPEKLQSYFASH